MANRWTMISIPILFNSFFRDSVFSTFMVPYLAGKVDIPNTGNDYVIVEHIGRLSNPSPGRDYGI
jgi:hypothetical protein